MWFMLSTVFHNLSYWGAGDGPVGPAWRQLQAARMWCVKRGLRKIGTN